MRSLSKIMIGLPIALLLLPTGCSESGSSENWGAVYNYPQLTDSDFLEKTRQGIFLIDFDAEWCGWCRKMDPHLAALSDTMGDRLTIAKIDYDRNPEAKRYFGATQGIPALFVVVDGRIVRSVLGYQTEEQLLDLVKDPVEQYERKPEEKTETDPSPSE